MIKIIRKTKLGNKDKTTIMSKEDDLFADGHLNEISDNMRNMKKFYI